MGFFFHEEFTSICNFHAPVLLVADEAFPLKTYMMRPYAGRLLDDAKEYSTTGSAEQGGY